MCIYIYICEWSVCVYIIHVAYVYISRKQNDKIWQVDDRLSLSKSGPTEISAFKVDHTAFLVNETCQSFFCLGRDIFFVSSLLTKQHARQMSEKQQCRWNHLQLANYATTKSALQVALKVGTTLLCVLRNIYAKGKQTQNVFSPKWCIYCILRFYGV